MASGLTDLRCCCCWTSPLTSLRGATRSATDVRDLAVTGVLATCAVVELEFRYRKPLPDLIIASVARVHGAVLVHHDRDFDDIATVVPTLRTRWIVPPR
jgi:hypothetical protein